MIVLRRIYPDVDPDLYAFLLRRDLQQRSSIMQSDVPPMIQNEDVAKVIDNFILDTASFQDLTASSTIDFKLSRKEISVED